MPYSSQMVNSGFTMEGARDFVNNLEAEMQNLNPSGLNLLHAKLGNDLTELQESLFTPFTPFIPHRVDGKLIDLTATD